MVSCASHATYPKRFKNPTISIIMPTKVQRRNTSAIPEKKQIVPRIFCLRAKKSNVFCGPMSIAIPATNKTLPSARSVASKKNTMPRKRNNTPPDTSPTPISHHKHSPSQPCALLSSLSVYYKSSIVGAAPAPLRRHAVGHRRYYKATRYK